MSRCAFYWQMFKGAFRHGWEAAHHVHMGLVLLGGVVLLIVAVSLEEFMAAGVICVLAFVVFVVAGLFEHAYHIYRRQREGRLRQRKSYSRKRREIIERHAAGLRELHEAEQAQQGRIKELQDAISHLRDELDPKNQRRLAMLRDLVERGRVFQQWFDNSDDSELFSALCADLPHWDDQVRRLLREEIPGEFASYLDPFGPPDLRNRSNLFMFLQRKMASLQAILSRVQVGTEPPR